MKTNLRSLAQQITRTLAPIAAAFVAATATSANGQSATTVEGVIQESIRFLQYTSPPPEQNVARTVEFDFTISDGTGVISGPFNGVYLKLAGENVNPILSGVTISTKGSKVHLTTNASGTYRHNRLVEPDQTFTVQSPSEVLTLAKGFVVTYKTRAGAQLNKIEFGNHLTVTKISTGTQDTEYLIHGVADPANPKKVVTFRIVLRRVYFG